MTSDQRTDLGVGDWREALLGLGVLGGQSQQAGHPQRHPGRGALGRDPETDPAHDHDQDGGDVGGEEEVAGVPLQLEHGREAGEGAGGVVDGAVLSPEGLYLQLGQSERESEAGTAAGHCHSPDVRTHHQGLNDGSFQNTENIICMDGMGGWGTVNSEGDFILRLP